ncbi:enoyl-CoA hydratase/isomerase family protein [Amycolatopsis regifaucium]|uniref:Enoyl-CoA hydratase n=1 Tax=Amycolatopsis regifaucium TaxID=546365 RepID=A0A154MT51_9PSEU|nr:enoyl-CoA hydratase/isomerase family protein [Amycolatopsis regifaucium]KZB86669.1 enoyl-CoA hydratase [Amycolatopsis regifaucium]OKA03700.1 enoyl-CoA hydratase [Amycolatopsis regifaucium]SFJ20955.1 enoyl-CoA hydratase [Amycolatopsis regifaucium]
MATSSIRVDDEGGIAVVTLQHGKANTLDTEFCRELIVRLEDVQLGGYRGVVLTGSGSIFSAGVDLRRVHDGGAAYIEDFLPALSDAFLSVFGFPGPVVAALNGHAIAGGAVLAAACDRRILASGPSRIGITELLVGVPFPLAALEILRSGFGADILGELAFLAETHLPDDALRLGLVDEVTAPETVLPRAVELAKKLAEIPAAAYAHTKAQLHRPFHERIAEHRTGDDAHVLELWSSPEALAAIEAYVGRVLRGQG